MFSYFLSFFDSNESEDFICPPDTVIDPDGTINFSNGAKILPDGVTASYPDGTFGSLEPMFVVDGTKHFMNSLVYYPQSKIVFEDTHYCNNGLVYKYDYCSQKISDMLFPDGTQILFY